MKNLKSVFCIALILTLGMFAFIGCNPPPTESTITLSEAKTLIINSLEESDGSTQTYSTQTASLVGNRNVFNKLGNISISLEGNFGFCKTINGTAQRKFGKWTKYSLESETISEFYDGTYAYTKNSSTKNSFDSSSFGLILDSVDCVYVDLLFIEEAWSSIYGETVHKSLTESGFVLTMDVNMSRYVDYVMRKAKELDLGSEGLFGEGDYLKKNKEEGKTELSISFNQNNSICGVSLAITSLASDWQFYTTKIDIEKSSNAVTPPDWLNN